MARSKTSRRGGAWYDPRSWFKPSCESAKKKSEEADAAAKKAKATKDEVCPGEASAADVPKETPVTDSKAPPATTGARRRRTTRRKAKHRKGH